MQREKLFLMVVSITLLLLISFIFWFNLSNTNENTAQSFQDEENTLTNTLFETEDFNFVTEGKVTLSGPDLCTIESVNLSSLNLKFDAFSLHLNGLLRNNSGLPKGTLTVNLTGDREKFYDLLVTNKRINEFEAEIANIYYGDQFRIIDGKIYFLFYPFKVIDSFPEIC